MKMQKKLLTFALAMVLALGSLTLPAATHSVSEAYAEEYTEGTEDLTEGSTEDETEGRTEGSTEDETEGRTEGSTEDETEGRTEGSTEGATEVHEETSAPEVVETAPPTKIKQGLILEGGKYRYYNQGVRLKNSWKSIKIKGTFYRYYFNDKGNAVTGFQKIKKVAYVFRDNGRLYKPSVKTVYTVGSTKYLVSPEGKALKGWNSKKTYYFGKDFKPVTGIQVIKDKFYCFKTSGQKNATRTTSLQKASKYMANMKGLYKLIGKPLKAKYYSGSCFGKGKDGVLTYKNFYVYTYKEGTKEICMGVTAR